MTAKEWRERGARQAEVELALPSGMVIRARRPGPMQFAEWNRLPLMLAAIETVAAGGEMEDEQLKDTADFMATLVMYCCIEPRVSLTPGEEEIHPSQIPQTDWTFLVAWALRVEEAAQLRSFRGRGDAQHDGGGGENVLVQTVGVAGDRGPGVGVGDRPGGDAPVGGSQAGGQAAS